MDTTTLESATDRATAWLARFDEALGAQDSAAAAALFLDDSFWRDFLAFTWNIKTIEGKDAITALLDGTLGDVRPTGWAIDGEATEADGVVEAWITFETGASRGWGHLRLKGGLCRTLLTTMTELKGHEEKTGEKRDNGVVHGAEKGYRNWLERKTQKEAELGKSRQPDCVIIGGGQGGIALGARLGRLGVSTIIIEKNERAGDSWRHRYRSLVLHDPIWYDHLPYLPFPDDWPVFCPKDKFGDWLEMYAKVMELNYWGSTECLGAVYDGAVSEWAVTVRRDGAETVLRPKQLVFATGAYGYPKVIDFPGADGFAGTAIHTSEYESGAAFAAKKCIVVGSGSSGHDIAKDLWEFDVDVTMVQRSPTIVIRSETLMDLGFSDLYSEKALQNGITTDKADMLFASMPFRLLPESQIPLCEEIAKVDAPFYERLAAAGFLIDFGEDGTGLIAKAFRTASGYYIDVGASDLIASGEIKLKSGVDITGIGERSMRFRDGSELPADVIIHATGYGSMDDMVEQIISPEVADKVGRFWGYGSGIKGDPGPWAGELRNMWQPTQQEALWFHGGNLALSRQFSLYVSLQIKARLEGIPTPVYGLADAAPR
jgi:putative flavoprotein involved in K+ transport